MAKFDRNFYAQTLESIANRLTAKGYLDVEGSIASTVVVNTANGAWHYPLKGAIDVVDHIDAAYMDIDPVTARVVGKGALDMRPLPEIEILWTGTDDELRCSTVDVAGAHFVPNQNL